MLSLLIYFTPSSVVGAELALVMDDLGHNWERDRRAVELATPMTVALLPFAPLVDRLAQLAHETGQEIILHQPMEPVRTHYHRVEPGTLTLEMAPEEFDSLLRDAISRLPHCVGVNNHTGSLLTQHAEPMTRLMQHLAGEGLYFLDSRTTPNTVAYQIAKNHEVPTVSRDVFLDHDPTPAALVHQFHRALAIARRNGSAVLIAHPYESTLSYLESALITLPEDIQLVPLSQVIEKRRPALPAMLVQPQNPGFLHR